MSIEGALLVAQVHHDDLRRQVIDARGGRPALAWLTAALRRRPRRG